MNDNNFYLNLFRVKKEDLDKLIATALAHGGDYADLYFERSSFMDLRLRDGEVSAGGFHMDSGVGIRVLDGERTGYAYTESFLPSDMLSAASAAGSISIAPQSAHPQGIHYGRAEARCAEGLYTQRENWRDCDIKRLSNTLLKLQDKVLAKDSRIIKVLGIISGQVSDIMMYNSLGELCTDTRPMGTIALSIVFSDGSTVQNDHVSRSYRMGCEMLTDSLLDELASAAVKDIDRRLQARRPQGGQMPVVMGAGASGILLHEAMGHAFEADFNRKGQSVFAGRIGELICNEAINIVDDGTLTGNRGSLHYDDEGVPGQCTYMVRDGRLESYLHDRLSAAHYGVSPTGNGRRESFRFSPIPRMRATYMLGGDKTPRDIISSVKKGIYVDEFANGQVKIGEGDFTFYVKSGFMIENGELTFPIKDINVSGNGPKALADISAVGNDLVIDEGAWTCGKGQSADVSCGIPTVLVDSLIIGGEQ